MIEHAMSAGHLVTMSFSDLSFWCYGCESYIKHPTLHEIFNAFYEQKFDEPPPVSDANGDGSIIRQLIAAIDGETDVEKDVPSGITIEAVAGRIRAGQYKRVVVLSGAGISVSAGIPDFRSPGTGLYANLQRFNLPRPEAIFDLEYFYENPEPFFALMKDLLPQNLKPTLTHFFLRLLQEKGILLRNFTQNIDMLERVAGIKEDNLVEAHGSFATGHCTNRDCQKVFPFQFIKDAVQSDQMPRCTLCGSIIKPDIIFFKESLSESFRERVFADLPAADLLLIIGTSLKVQPFNLLIDFVPETTPRVLINREEVASIRKTGAGFRFGMQDNARDVLLLGDCDACCEQIVHLCGWMDDLKSLMNGFVSHL
eukprot:GILJ01021617.1.p1 GENE.GILJ01021617.1~~GILJ01021617.1.p1  ORF type:complete len:368 (-),score=53.51 GILJ01021617.1:68-1171(-)